MLGELKPKGPKPSTLNHQSSTLNPLPYTLFPLPSTLFPLPSTLYPKGWGPKRQKVTNGHRAFSLSFFIGPPK
jgi:hypothetical protein